MGGTRVRLDYLLQHMRGDRLSRRAALRRAAQLGLLGGTAGAFASVGGGALRPDAAAADGHLPPEPITDEMFDVAAVEAGAWVPGPYGPGDQRGSFNEVTPEKTAAAWRLLDGGRPITTYNLGDLMFNGYPAVVTAPPTRTYQQRLTVLGYEPPADFEGIVRGTEPAGPNRISVHEERFPLGGTYQIATQLDNLNHVGVGAMFYNGFRGPEIARTYGTAALGNEHMGPIATRGILLDIIGLKVAQGATGDYFIAADGAPVLEDNYRITVGDIEAAMAREGLSQILPGDVVLFRTGWGHLVRTDPERYLRREPGIYLREGRYLARHRPALIGSDTWALEVLDPAVTGGNAVPVHQLLFLRYGIRIGEGIITDALAEDDVYEFVYIVSPQYALGATAGNTAPVALGQSRRDGPKKR